MKKRDTRTVRTTVATILLTLGFLFTSQVFGQEPVTLTVWSLLNPSPEGSPREQALHQIIEEFTAETGIEVQVETLPWQELDSTLITAVQGGSPPDLTWTNFFWLNQQVEAGTLMPLDEFVARDLTQEEINDYLLWDATVVDDQKWTAHTSFVPKALFIRQDWLEEAGLEAPETWEEFVEVAEAFTRDRRHGYAFGASATQPNQSEMIFQGMIEGRGGAILDEEGNAVFNSPAGVETFEFLRDLVHEHGVVPQAVASMTYDDVTDAFEAGRVGMIIDGSHRYNRIVRALGEENVQLARVPGPTPEGSPSVIAGWTLGIPRNSAHPEEAWEFIKFFTSAEGQAINSRIAGEVPVRASVVEEPFFASPEAEHLRWWLDYIADQGTMTVNPRQWTRLNELLAEGLQTVILNPQADVQQVLDELVDQYNRGR